MKVEAKRDPLTRQRVVQGAVAVADAGGLGSLTMRSLAQALGVKPMALYHHVANKEDLIDGMVDEVFAEIEVPANRADWPSMMRGVAVSTRAALARHPWAIPLMGQRLNPGPATLGYYEDVLSLLHDAGLSVSAAGHITAALDSYVYGSALTESEMPTEDASIPELAEAFLERVPEDRYPRLAAFTRDHVLQPGFDYGAEFAFGLDLLLDGLERWAKEEGGRR